MDTVYRITIPGKGFEQAMTGLRSQMAAAARSRAPIPISMFFNYFDLAPENVDLEPDLIARGSLMPADSGSGYSNTGGGARSR